MFKRRENVTFNKAELAQWNSDTIDIPTEQGHGAKKNIKRAFLVKLVGAHFKIQKAKEKNDLIMTIKKRFLR